MCNSAEYGAIHSHTNTPKHTGAQMRGCNVEVSDHILQRSWNHLGSLLLLIQQLLASSTQQRSAQQWSQIGSSLKPICYIYTRVKRIAGSILYSYQLPSFTLLRSSHVEELAKHCLKWVSSLERHSQSRFFALAQHMSASVRSVLTNQNPFVLRLNQEQPRSSCSPRFAAVRRGMLCGREENEW